MMVKPTLFQFLEQLHALPLLLKLLIIMELGLPLLLGEMLLMEMITTK